MPAYDGAVTPEYEAGAAVRLGETALMSVMTKAAFSSMETAKAQRLKRVKHRAH